MAYRRRSREFESLCKAATFRVGIVLRTVEALAPDFSPQKKKRLCNRILTLLDGQDRTVKITQAQAQDLILPHMQCISRSVLHASFGNRLRAV